MEEVYNEKQRWRIDQEFGWIKDNCYLDYAGAALYSSHQIKASGNDLCSNLYGNPHSHNQASINCRDAIDQIRYRMLNFFHTNSEEYSIIFTSGATSAIKLVVENFLWDGIEQNKDERLYSTKEGWGNYVYMASNHTSVVGGRELAAERGAKVTCLSDAAVEKQLSETRVAKNQNSSSNSLFVYPAQCNFSGRKYPLEWVERIKNGGLSYCTDIKETRTTWYVLLDAATYCSTNDLDLSRVLPDFVCVSFYKIFGFPTGLGALLVRITSTACLGKRYFGGGTVDFALPSRRFHRLRKCLHERFEDGTLPYLSILSLSHGLDTLERLGLTMRKISLHVFSLARHAVLQLKTLRHWNGYPLVQIYADSDSPDIVNQGGIVTFNLKRSDGSYIGYIEVLHVANSCKIQIRTGCFCNIGACQRHIQISDTDLISNFEAGHVCGDERDIISGKPTGAIRVSFGYPSSLKDVHSLVCMLRENFLQTAPASDLPYSQLVKNPTLHNIMLYPVKSCGAMEVTSWPLTMRGLHLDRQWMVVAANGVCLTQKHEPLLCRVLPTVDPDTEDLTLTFSGEDSLVVLAKDCNEQDKNYNVCTNKVCGDKVEGLDCGSAAADWLACHLHRDGLRLIRQRKDDGRISKIQGIRGRSGEKTGQLSLANQAQYLVISANSIDWLRQRIADEPDFNQDTLKDRFRANFIVGGSEPFDELTWRSIKIGNITFKVEGPCTRCQIICIDQQTGEKNRKPLVELSRALEGKLRFGIYCSHVDAEPGVLLQVGDAITVEKDVSL